MKITNRLKSESGQITLDFLFAVILIGGVAALLAALTFALTLTEVLQYVSFAGARAYFAADIDQATQQSAAQAKVNALLSGKTSLPFLSGAESSGWIVVSSKSASDFSTSYEQQLTQQGMAGQPPKRDQFTGGYQIQFNVPILHLKIPLLGEAGPTPEDNSLTVSSFLMREPTFTECSQYMNAIYPYLIKIMGTSNSTVTNAQTITILDNGC